MLCVYYCLWFFHVSNICVQRTFIIKISINVKLWRAEYIWCCSDTSATSLSPEKKCVRPAKHTASLAVQLLEDKKHDSWTQPFKAYWLHDATSLTFNNCTLCPHCFYEFCIHLETYTDLCHLHHKLIGFYNRDEKCLLRGMNWVFK